jgi:hypothetical protein
MDIMVIYVNRDMSKFYGSEKLSWRARLFMGQEGATRGDGESGRRHVFDGPGVEARRLDIESLRAPPA